MKIVELISAQFKIQYYILSVLILVVAFYVIVATTLIPYFHSREIRHANSYSLGKPVIPNDTSIRYDLRSSRAIRYKAPPSPTSTSPTSSSGQGQWYQRKTRSKSTDSSSSASSSGSNPFLVDEADVGPPPSPSKQPAISPSQYSSSSLSSSTSTSSTEEKKLHYKFQSTYIVEYLVAISLFCLVGGQVVFVAYIKEYISRTNILSEIYGTYVLMLFWIFVSAGRLVGVFDQRSISATNVLISHLILCCILGSIAIGFVIHYSTSMIVFLIFGLHKERYV
jgi:hypothetical protein